VIGLGTTGFISTIGLDAKLASTTQGLGTAGYISSSQLISTVAGLNTYTSSFIDATELASSINSLGSLGYVSTFSLVSTTRGLGSSGYISSVISSFITLSTANMTTSSVTFFDAQSNNVANNVYVQSSFLYFNNYIVSGANQLQPQFITF
jgi:hypothetical protein